MCSHDRLNVTDCPQAHVTLTGSNDSNILLHVYNISTLFPGFCEVFSENSFEIPPMVAFVENITKNHEFGIDFGDGDSYTLSNRTHNRSYVSHRYLKPGHYQVMLRSQLQNVSVCHAYRDIIVQQGVVVRGVTCPSHVKTNGTMLCNMDLLSGTNMTVDLEVVSQNNTSVKQGFQLQGNLK